VRRRTKRLTTDLFDSSLVRLVPPRRNRMVPTRARGSTATALSVPGAFVTVRAPSAMPCAMHTGAYAGSIQLGPIELIADPRLVADPDPADPPTRISTPSVSTPPALLRATRWSCTAPSMRSLRSERPRSPPTPRSARSRLPPQWPSLVG
jgi:hypothetical protein